MSEQRFRSREHEVVADVARQGQSIVVRRDGEAAPRRFTAQRVGTAEYVLSEADDGGRKHTVYALRDGDDVWVHVDGRTWLLQRVRSRRAAPAPGSLSAPIPATVQEVLVADGDPVQQGQVLLVVTAMKMQLEIKAPHAGVVRGLDSKVGDQVEAGQQLLRIETL